MKAIACLKIFACAASFIGCTASFPPRELIDARQACAHASATPATLLVPVEMRRAHEALASAEESFLDNPGSGRTRDLASQAYRLAKRAEVLARVAADSVIIKTADKTYDLEQIELTASRRRRETALESGGKHTSGRPATEQQLALNAAIYLKARLATLALVTEEDRGLVCTLSGDALFTVNTSKLTLASQHILEQVTQALMATKERKLTVEGHTDSRGSSSHSRMFSQHRADAVRTYIIECGYPGNLIVAEGFGIDKPVADNVTIGGRAKNRRVEIIVARATR
jgi:outer membrane protein OmpA-like peptidoglycan-associated protein